ncbi:MAG: DNA polymerase III subunit delta, partial [Alphaproteobacteria bacterium]|nr:DNA polymerase III subunit delta [Alphaproteobacteria bacterium]
VTNAAAVPCYVEDERDISRLIRETLQGAGLSAEPDAVTSLASAITGDRAKARSELEKLITYKGAEKSPVTLADVHAVCGDAGAQNLDDLIYAVANREAAKAFRSFEILQQEGVALIAILRALQNHFRKLHLTHAYMSEGLRVEEAMKKLSPPIFFKQEAAFKAQIARWPMDVIAATLTRLSDLEAQTKKTGIPAETLTAQAILGLSAARR